MPSPQYADQTVTHAIAQPRLAIEALQPILEGGRCASKCLSGRPLPVSAVIFSDGHEKLAADLLWRANGEATWQRTPMQALGNDRWSAVLRIDQQGRG
ncbi:MAG: alpha-1,4-glucan--maltose-1-phosphate maltosyltransferase, partial [Stutzerimonas stutzeri]